MSHIRLTTICLIAFSLLMMSINFVYAQSTQSLTVFAAASLADVFGEIGEAFKTENPNTEIVFNFGGSSTLATQIIEGAPADIFASANTKQMTVVQDADLISGKPRTFVKNRLVVVVPADNPANIEMLSDLANPGVKLVVAASDVPVRDYTNTMLDRMVTSPLYGEAYKAAVIANFVSEEDNVRQVSLKVSLGEADAGIVYLSDVTPDISAQVKTIAIPDSFNTLATYPIAMLKDTANAELAQKFIDYVLSDVGQATFVKWGFISVRIPDLPNTVILNLDGNLHIDGQVLNPLSLSMDDLKANYTNQTVEVTYKSGEETVTATFTGILLWDVLNNAQVNLNADVKNDKLSLFIVASAADGYQTVMSWGEIDPEFGNQPILIAFEQDGQPLDGGFQLVVPGDQRGGRYVHNLVNLSVRDAPIITQ